MVSIQRAEPPEGWPSHYENAVPLAQGRFGTVWYAEDTVREAPAAVKVPNIEDNADRAAFEQEIEIASQTDHPNLLRAYEWGRGDLTYLTMPWITGGSLEQALKTSSGGRKALPFEDVLALGDAVAAGLGALHNGDVVHRDIQPANILVERGPGRDQYIVGDYGLSVWHARPDRASRLRHFGYAAPELLEAWMRGGEPHPGSPESDMFSAGAVLYHAASGHSPYQHKNMAQAAERLAARVTPLATRNPDLPREFTAVVDRLMAENPAERPASAQELRADLAAVREAVRKPVSSVWAPYDRTHLRHPNASQSADGLAEIVDVDGSAAPPYVGPVPTTTLAAGIAPVGSSQGKGIEAPAGPPGTPSQGQAPDVARRPDAPGRRESASRGPDGAPKLTKRPRPGSGG